MRLRWMGEGVEDVAAGVSWRVLGFRVVPMGVRTSRTSGSLLIVPLSFDRSSQPWQAYGGAGTLFCKGERRRLLSGLLEENVLSSRWFFLRCRLASGP